jgi:kumamolisin
MTTQTTTPRFASQTRVALAGSDRKPFSPGPALAAAEPIAVEAQGDDAGRITVSVIIPPKTLIDSATLGNPAGRLTRDEFAAKHGPQPASVQMVREFAAEFNLMVGSLGNYEHTRTLHLTGSQDELEKAFGVKLEVTSGYRTRTGSIMIPQELSGHVQAVLGLDDRPQASSHHRIATARATNVSYTPVQVAELYSFPAKPSAAGQTIGLIELGGGFRAADITAYFASLNLPAPTVTAVSVDKGKNKPGNASGADGEVMLDIEVSASVAPGAAVAVYFAPNTDQGFTDAITQAVHDTTHKPSVISISWGGPESTWTAQALTAMDQACQAAAALGISITVACGDSGSTDGVSGTANHVDFPASSPHVLACGGTKLTGTVSGTTGKITSEVVWNELAANEGATGGGVSTVFAKPTWQASANVPKPTTSAGGRGTPDVSGNADPSTGYNVRVDGESLVIGGTSAVAPLWAGLIALANAANKTTAGFLNPTLYANPAAFHDITSGNNGSFSAAKGWDACTGLGSPIGTSVIKALGGSSSTTTASGIGKKHHE